MTAPTPKAKFAAAVAEWLHESPLAQGTTDGGAHALRMGWATLPPELEAMPVNDDTEKLRAFAQDVMEHWYESALDDGDLQALGEKHGMLEPRLMADACSLDGCQCAEIGEFPLTCYRKTPLLLGQPLPPPPKGASE